MDQQMRNAKKHVWKIAQGFPFGAFLLLFYVFVFGIWRIILGCY